MGSGDGLSGCYACIKYLMFAFNFIFWLIGCALVGVGIWVLVDDGFKQLANAEEFAFLQYAGIALIAIGGIVMVVGFFGCCGAIRESQCLLGMFFVCMLLLFLILVAGGVFVLVRKEDASKMAMEVFKEGVEKWTKDEDAKFVDLIQSVFKCCGVKDESDYPGSEKPDSCKGHLETGCGEKVPEELNKNVVLAAGVALGAGAVMLLGMIFSMLLCCAIRDQDA